jgi:hypothetical protein
MRLRPLVQLALLSLFLTRSGAAQTHRRFSLQTSAIYVLLSGDSAFSSTSSGLGGEAQLRLNISSISIGGGVQFSRHTSTGLGNVESEVPISLLGAFLEPRCVLPGNSNVYAAYLSARIAYFQQQYSSRVDATAGGSQFNVGGGVLVSATRNVNIDLGLTTGAMRFGGFHVPAGSGHSEYDVLAQSGRNLVLRAGVAIGLGSGK